MRRTLATLAWLTSATALSACGETSSRPTASEVEETVESAYAAPDRHVLTLREASADTITWARSYDGVAMLSEVKSARLSDGVTWETRFHHEKTEPEPVRTADVISFADAARAHGLGDELAGGQLHHRLVYRPEFENVAKAPVVRNAKDAELVITRYRLAIELESKARHLTVYVDAYTNEEIARVSSARDMDVWANGQRYAPVPLDVDSRQVSRWEFRYTLRDPVRSSVLTPTNVHVNGQGILANGQQLSTTYGYSPFTYYEISSFGGMSAAVDVAFSLRESWDYFAAVHGRRGLKNLQPAADAFANDVVAQAVGDPSQSTNMWLVPEEGLLTLSQGSTDPIAGYLTLDGIGHEYSHGIFHNVASTSPDFYFGEHGGLDEATADIFGEAIEAYGLHELGKIPTARIQDLPNPFEIFGQPGARATLRWMCKPSRDGHSFDSWQFGMHLFDAHYTSGPMNRMFCLLSRGMTAPGTGNPDLESPLVPTGFTGLGDEVAAKLWYAALARLHGYPAPLSFLWARLSMLEAAIDLYGAHSPEYKAVEDAFAAVLVGDPADRDPPVVTLLHNVVGTPFETKVSDPAHTTLLDPGSSLEVDATDPAGVAKVEFAQFYAMAGCSGMDNTLTNPPWETPAPSTSGTCPIWVRATDTHNNSSAWVEYTAIVDADRPYVWIDELPPCGGGFCPDGRDRRTYRVSAKDPSGVKMLSLTADGGTPTILNGSWALADTATMDVPVTFGDGEAHQVVAVAMDNMGNLTTTSRNVVVDRSPPVFTSGPSVTESQTTDGLVELQMCAQDPSGIYHFDVTMNNGWTPLHTVETHPAGTVSGCWRWTKEAMNPGTYTFKFPVDDRWGNWQVVPRVITVAGIAPTAQYRGRSTNSNGSMTFRTSAQAQRGVNTVRLYFCHGAATCELVATTSPNSTSPNLLPYDFTIFGTPGASYQGVKIEAVGQNTLTGSLYVADPFTVPTPSTTPPGDVVYNEVEANNVYTSANPVNSSGSLTYNVVRGTMGASTDLGDFFRIWLPAGKDLRLALARTGGTCPYDQLYYYVASLERFANNTPILPITAEPSRAAITSSDFTASNLGGAAGWMYVKVQG
jgi:hypothetical protein